MECAQCRTFFLPATSWNTQIPLLSTIAVCVENSLALGIARVREIDI